MASPMPAAASELSPGPLRMSDLDPTISELHTTSDLRMPPRRLDPISPTRKKKRTKKRRTKRAPQEEQGYEGSLGGDLIGESALSQLRARLDPIYNSPPIPPLDLNNRNTNDGTTEQQGNGEGRGRDADTAEGGTVTAPQDLSGPAGGTNTDSMDPHLSHKSSRRKRIKRGRKRDEKEREEPEEPTPAPLQEREPHGEEEIEGSHTPLSEMPPDSSFKQGRQLPAFPSDAGDPLLDGTIPGPTLADHLALGTGQLQNSLPVRSEYGLPDDPQFLVSEEDIEEEVDGPITRLHTSLVTSSHPHPTTTSHSKEVIFVERKDGRGFTTQQHDAGGPAGGEQGDIEGATGREEREVSSAEFALYTHKAIQSVMLSAHGMVAGISLWDCVVSNTLSWQPNRHLDLLQYYNLLTLPVHAVYVFLLSLAIVSLFDRFDVARPDRQCLESFIRAPSRIILFIVLVLIFLALMVTISVIAVDERIALYPLQPSLWSDVLTPINTSSSQDIPSPTTHSAGVLVYVPAGNLFSSLLSPWLALVIVRAICCCISWLLVVWVRDYDRLQDYLSRMAGNTHCVNG